MNKFNINIIDDITTRLVYSFYLRDDINSYDELINDPDYNIHFKCLTHISNICSHDNVIFIISTNNSNEALLNDIKINLSRIFRFYKSISFIIEPNFNIGREGTVFRKYILNKLDEYDGLTLFFHNKRTVKSNGPSFWSHIIDEDVTYWIIGQYYFNMYLFKEELGSFMRKQDKLIYGWPYMHDNYHPQWLIGGNCFWMKCQEIEKYIKDNNITNTPISERCISEFIFPEIFKEDLIDYPCSGIIKEYIETGFYEPGSNKLFIDYLKNVLPYNTYVNFMNFYNDIMNYTL